MSKAGAALQAHGSFPEAPTKPATSSVPGGGADVRTGGRKATQQQGQDDNRDEHGSTGAPTVGKGEPRGCSGVSWLLSHLCVPPGLSLSILWNKDASAVPSRQEALN